MLNTRGQEVVRHNILMAVDSRLLVFRWNNKDLSNTFQKLVHAG